MIEGTCMRYKIMNKIIEYSLLTNDRFNVLFDKYKFFDEKSCVKNWGFHINLLILCRNVNAKGG